jgi:phosphatidylinositol phospholipase C delta
MYKMCAMPFGRRKPLKGDMGQDLRVALFAKYSENGKMGAAGLLKFLQEEQGERDLTLDDAKRILELHKKEHGGILKFNFSHDMTKDDFSAYLLSPKLNGVLPSTVYQDMTQPLAHYFIFTGHNSYLTGNQLSSDSSVEPIKVALQRGVRVVELDLWPDDHGGVKVTHGNTLTKPVAFEKCIVAIRDNAFINSEYPVCVTLEDHLTSPLQATAAEILTRILGDTLYYPKTSEALSEFPSPDSLKRRIIVSTKPPKESFVPKAALEDKALVEELEKEDAQEETSSTPIKEGSAAHRIGNVPEAPSTPSSVTPASPTPRDSDSDEDDSKKNPVYARLITIRQAKPVKGTSMKDRLKVEESVKRISLAESKLKDVVEEFPELVVKFTQRNILRIYPDGSRVNSSNYNPIPAWNHGAQMVAQNMQGYGKELWQAHGKFRGNGGCGFILKPKFLLENSPDGHAFNPASHHSKEIAFKVKMMMTQGWNKAFSKRHFDLFSPPDFFTRVLVTGVPADAAKWKTSVVDNKWEPHWNEEHEFTLKVPELALLRLEVRDYDEESKDEFEGQTCLPIHEIRDGYRCVQMYDKKGNELKEVKMLIHFQKRSLHGEPTAPVTTESVTTPV